MADVCGSALYHKVGFLTFIKKKEMEKKEEECGGENVERMGGDEG